MERAREAAKEAGTFVEAFSKTFRGRIDEKLQAAKQAGRVAIQQLNAVLAAGPSAWEAVAAEDTDVAEAETDAAVDEKAAEMVEEADAWYEVEEAEGSAAAAAAAALVELALSRSLP